MLRSLASIRMPQYHLELAIVYWTMKQTINLHVCENNVKLIQTVFWHDMNLIQRSNAVLTF